MRNVQCGRMRAKQRARERWYALRRESTATEEKAGGGEGLETDTEIGSTEEERDEAHAIRPEKGQGTSMPTQEPREANADNGRMGLGGSRRERYGLGFPPRPKISRSLPLAHTGGCAVRWGRMS